MSDARRGGGGCMCIDREPRSNSRESARVEYQNERRRDQSMSQVHFPACDTSFTTQLVEMPVL